MGHSIYRTLQLVRSFNFDCGIDYFERAWRYNFSKISNPTIRETLLGLKHRDLVQGDTWVYYQLWDAIVKVANGKRPPQQVTEIYEGYRNYKAICGHYALDFPYVINHRMKSGDLEPLARFLGGWHGFARGKDFFLLGKFDLAEIIASQALTGGRKGAVQLTLFGHLGEYNLLRPVDILRAAFPESRVDEVCQELRYSSYDGRKRRISDPVFYKKNAIAVMRVEGPPNNAPEYYYRTDWGNPGLVISQSDLRRYIWRYSSWWQANRGQLDELRDWISTVCSRAFECQEYKRCQERAAKAGILPQDFKLMEIPPAALQKRAEKIQSIREEAQNGARERDRAERQKLNKDKVRVLSWVKEVTCQGDAFPVKDEPTTSLEEGGLTIAPIRTTKELAEVAKALKNCANSGYRRASMMTDKMRLLVCRNSKNEPIGLAEISRARPSDKDELMLIPAQPRQRLRGVSALYLGNMVEEAMSGEGYYGFYRSEDWDRMLKLGKARFQRALSTAIYGFGCCPFEPRFQQMSGVRNNKLPDHVKEAFELYRATHLVDAKPLVKKPEPLPRKAPKKAAVAEGDAASTPVTTEASMAAVEAPVAA